MCTFEVSNVFRDCQVLICDFHREQAQLNTAKNDARIVKEIILCTFRRIAGARKVAELQQSLHDLRNYEYWKGGYVNMVNWFEKQ